MKHNNTQYKLALVFAMFLFTFYITQKINFVNADLGRHLKNGEIISQGLEGKISGWKDIFYKNYYSYTEPDHVFINHHWGTGLIFYQISRLGGFEGVSIFYISLRVIAFFIVFFISYRLSNFPISLAISFFLLPVITARDEIRPEVFTYLFSPIFFWILWKFRSDPSSARMLWILPFIMVFWVNTNLYFIVGLALIGFFLGEEVLFYLNNRRSPERERKIKILGMLMLITIIATFLNPFGIKGAVYPFHITQDIGLQIDELRPMPILPDITSRQINYIILGLAILGAIISLFLARFSKKDIPLSLFWLGIFIFVAIIKFNRNNVLFGQFFIIIASYSTFVFLENRLIEKTRSNSLFFPFLKVFILIMMLLINLFKVSKLYNDARVGLGLSDDSKSALEFLENHPVPGPIFNDFNSSSFSIYALFPKQSVFVDQRPEAYDNIFFRNVYFPAINYKDAWERMENIYGFNTILSTNPSEGDLKEFLKNRKSSGQWTTAFENSSFIVLERQF